MYRFNRDDNLQARHFFETSLQLDPTFSRPYAGLSFTHFQSAFLDWGERSHEIEQAYRAASRGLMADEHDPAAHWAMGRALWLRGRLDESLSELDTSVELSPNFALGHYTLAFIHAQSGDAQAAVREADHSRDLSPFDPLLFAMLATRAVALIRLGRFEEAADWGAKAAVRPNAHVHVLAIAAHCLALAGRIDEARAITAAIHRQVPRYRVDDFLTAFRFAHDGEALIRRAAKLIGLA
jgi:tetratricopeptide (TPR) repeat protein